MREKKTEKRGWGKPIFLEGQNIKKNTE